MTDRRTDHPTTIAILGGTGALGRGLAVRFARAGIRVRLGSRDADRAQTRAAAITERPGVPSGSVTGHVTDEAVGDAEVVVLCTPYDAQAATLDAVRDQLAGRVLVSCVNPLRFDADGPHPVAVPEGSAAQAAAARVPDARVVAPLPHRPAAALDAAHGGDDHARAVAAQLGRIRDPEQTPSARILRAMRDGPVPFFRFAMDASERHARHFRDHPLDPASQSRFQEQSAESLRRQSEIEAADSMDFATYRQQYIEQELLPGRTPATAGTG
ncbi:MAG: NAD(P)-binding domain-containing protein [Nitriliruptoraceae bacterium]|nr:NAD(P)-binding domain-containing protein [Nitriliruptoraceae bacterium]